MCDDDDNQKAFDISNDGGNTMSESKREGEREKERGTQGKHTKF